MTIRYLTPEDDWSVKREISMVYEESWKYAYKEIIPQHYLDSISDGQWVSNLDVPDRYSLICIDCGNIVGTASFSESRSDRFAKWGEIISIYLLPEYIGRGYGKALLEAAIAELRKMGYNNIFLWVLEENSRARRFYEKMGFVLSDDYLDDIIGGKKLREIGYIYRN